MRGFRYDEKRIHGSVACGVSIRLRLFRVKVGFLRPLLNVQMASERRPPNCAF
jgi:hypothetical protein